MTAYSAVRARTRKVGTFQIMSDRGVGAPLPSFKLFCSAAMLLALCAAAINAFADYPIPGYPDSVLAYDAREVDMLPRYCIHTQTYRERLPGGSDPAEVTRWYAIQGPTFHHMHHYCWGLMRTNRALILARTKEARDSYLHYAVLDFDYVIERASAEFVLLPEILTKKGENLIRLRRGPAGVLQLERAMALKPDYWPPYTVLSDYYKSAGDLVSAREVLKKASSFAPDAKPIQRRLKELDSAQQKAKPRAAK